MAAAVTCQAQMGIRFTSLSDSAELLAPGFISTGRAERDFALSPDGTMLFFTLKAPGGSFQTILYSHRDINGNWSAPEVAPFAGQYADLEASFSPDGKRVYFSSNRPLQGTVPKDFDIWYVEKNEKGEWGSPVHTGPVINTDKDEFYPVMTRSGNLYFTASYAAGKGREDIYVAAWKDGKYEQPVSLDGMINTAAYEFNAYVSPDERFIIYSSYGRQDEKGGGDLYMNVKDTSGNWLPAVNLGLINSSRLDYSPFVNSSQSVLFFTTEKNNLPQFYNTAVSREELLRRWDEAGNGAGDIYHISFKLVEQYYYQQLQR